MSCVFREKSVLVVVVVVVVKFLYYFFSRACINKWSDGRKRDFLFPFFCFLCFVSFHTRTPKKSNREEARDIIISVIAAFLHFPNEGEDDDDDTTDESI